MEYLVTMTTNVPDGTPDQAVADVRAREAAHSSELTAPERPGAGGVMTGKVAIITGGSQGIGAGLVAGYSARGWSVVASARTIKPTGDPEVLAVEGDLADPATAERIISAALERFGRIDTLVNNAGVFISKPFTDYTAADYATAVGVNLTGFFWLTQRAIATMARGPGGHVVNLSATLAEVASSGTPAVLAALTKAAWPRPPGRWPSSTPPAASGSTPSRRASSRPRCTRPKATTASAIGFRRSAGSARSATSSTACCSSSHRPT